MISQKTFMTLMLTGVFTAAVGISQAGAQYPPMQINESASNPQAGRQQISAIQARHNTGRSRNSNTGHSISLKRVVMVDLHRTADRLPMVDPDLMREVFHMAHAAHTLALMAADRGPGITVAAGIVVRGVAIMVLGTGLVATGGRMVITVLSAICSAAAEMASGECILMNG